jgi:hypothetical protein
MYITAIWVQAPSKDLGTNIFAHPGFSPSAELGEAPTVSDAERVAADPGPEDKSLRRAQIKPGMNRVLAYIDVVLDEQPGDIAGRIRGALARHDASSDAWAEHEGVFVRFFLQPYMSARSDAYGMLRAQLDTWLNEHFPSAFAAAG